MCGRVGRGGRETLTSTAHRHAPHAILDPARTGRTTANVVTRSHPTAPPHRSAHRLLALLLLLAWLDAGAAHEATPLGPLSLNRPLDLFALSTVLHDPSGHDDLTQALARAETQATLHPESVAREGQHYWLVSRFEVHGHLPPTILRLGNMLFDEWAIYLLHEGRLIQHEVVAAAPPPGSPPSLDLSHLIPLQMGAEGEYTLAIRVSTRLFHRILVDLSSADRAIDQHVYQQAFNYAVFGALIALACYHLFIGLALLQITYIWYSLLAGTYLVYYLVLQGVMQRLFGIADPNLNLYIASATCARLFSLLFFCYMLDLRATAPRLRRLFLLTLALTVIQLVGEQLVDFYDALLLNRAMHLLIAPLLLYSAWRTWRQGFSPARYLVLGSLVMVVALAVRLLTVVGWIPYTALTPQLTFALLCLEVILFALALADRFKLLQRERSRQEEQNRSKHRFLTTLNHEIRSPLAVMLGEVGELRRTTQQGPYKEQVETLHYTGQALLDLVDNLLDYARNDEGRIPLHQVPFNLHRLVTSLHTLYAPRAAGQGLTLRLQLDPAIPARLVGDAVRIRQVLTNLLSNALRFSTQGEITFCVALERRRESDVELTFSVTDQGQGIRADDLPHIFERFYQGQGPGHAEGSGLGLAISQEIVTQMGGTIRVESTLGEGSHFHFRLPLAFEFPSAAPGHTPLPRYRILVVDDEALNREVIGGLLRNLGQEVVMADGGVAALEQFELGRFDLVLLDWRMPMLNGAATAARMRLHTDPLRASTPIYIATAQGPQADPHTYLGYGINGVMFKPLGRSQLTELLTGLKQHRRGEVA